MPKLSKIIKAYIIMNILDTLDEGVSHIDKEFRVIYQNGFMNKLFGDCIGKHCYKAYHNRQSPCENCCLNEVIRTGEQKKETRQLVSVDHSIRWLELISSPFKNKDGYCWCSGGRKRRY